MRRWLLPASPDLLGILAEQGRITVEAMEALSSWARGDAEEGSRVHELERQGEVASRRVVTAVRGAFLTPLSPEDLYELSERLDTVLTAAKNLVREAELLAMEPDPAMAEMLDLVGLGVRNLVEALAVVSSDPTRATERADAAVGQQRSLEHVYRRAMSALLQVDNLHLVAGRRELYRRCARMGDAVEGVAHRIWYAVVKDG